MKWITACYFNFKEKDQIFKFNLFPNIINTYSYKYEFYDMVDKDIKKCKIYSRFSHLKENGFEFKKGEDHFKDDMLSINLFDNYRTIKTSYALF